MSDVKWIKLSTDMFGDEKIKLIENMPDSDTILIIWVKLLAQAGKTNASGYIYLNENIPYTDEMLATIFDRPIGTVRLALETFKDFGMIDIDENSFIKISNWEHHQNIEGMERVKKLNAERNKRYRERKKQKKTLDNKTSDVTVTSRDGTEQDTELELELEQEEEEEQQQETDQHNTAAITQFWDNNGFGYNNVNAKQQLLSWLDDSQFKDPKSIVIKAMEIACSNNKRRLNYVEGILRNWENESLLTVQEIEQFDKKSAKPKLKEAEDDGRDYGF